jgi:hypothetical protein
MKILSFDLETANVLPSSANLHDYMPLDISVGATAIDGGEEKLWYSFDDDGSPASKMSRETAQELLKYLSKKQSEGYMVCGWNSLSFDFYCLAGASGMYTKSAEIAKKSYDPMYQFFNHFGFYIGLQAVADGMDLKFKKSLKGSDVPTLWQEGKYEEIFPYVMDDCKVVNQIVKQIMDTKWIVWKSKKGDYPTRCLGNLHTCEYVMAREMADQSWMTGSVPQKWSSTKWFPNDTFPSDHIGAKPPEGMGINLFRVSGADKNTAQDVVLELEAPNNEQALTKANALGIFVSNTTLIQSGQVNTNRKDIRKLPNRSTTIFILGLLGLTCSCIPLSIVVLVLANKDLKAMDAGSMVEDGRTMTSIGRAFAVVGFVIQAITLISLFAI